MFTHSVSCWSRSLVSCGNVKQENISRNWTDKLPQELLNNLGLMIWTSEELLRLFTWVFIDLMIRGNELVTRGFELATREFEHATRRGRITGSNPRVNSSHSWVTSSNPRVASSNSQVMSSNSRVASLNSRVTSSNRRVTNSNPGITRFNPQVTSSNLQVTRSNPRIIKSMETQVSSLKSSSFLKIISPKLFDNSSGNLYVQFLVVISCFLFPPLHGFGFSKKLIEWTLNLKKET